MIKGRSNYQTIPGVIQVEPKPKMDKSKIVKSIKNLVSSNNQGNIKEEKKEENLRKIDHLIEKQIKKIEKLESKMKK